LRITNSGLFQTYVQLRAESPLRRKATQGLGVCSWPEVPVASSAQTDPQRHFERS
jgi:hypothetical protein